MSTKFEHITSERLTLKLATTPGEIEAAQRLRYDIFYTEMGAHPVGDMATRGIDYDAYDPICDHLIVVDEHAPPGRQVVGTYRILLAERAAAHSMCLYSETEFDLSRLRAAGGRIMEISRSCIHPDYRTKIAINLLWKGIAACVFDNDIAYLIGTPSFQGINPHEHHTALSYLQAFHAAPDDILPVALPPKKGEPSLAEPLALLPATALQPRQIFNNLPPLIKGYLRIGVTVGKGFFIDRQFNTVDICVVLDIARVADRYLNHYKRAETHD